MIAWMNNNEGFLMVIITFVYVVATIFICVFNSRSAKASRDQIIASQKHQTQNMGLQLYSLRRETINKIGNHQFDEVLWDVSLLFDNDSFDKFASIGKTNARLTTLNILIKSFEDELDIILSSNSKTIISSQIVEAKVKKNYDRLCSSLKQTLGADKDGVIKSIDEYIANLKKADELQKCIDQETLQLIMELRELTLKSIQQI